MQANDAEVRISVILPVHDSEPYLDRCLESILNQSFTDFELIIIDDGSKDMSLMKCRGYADRDARIKIFHTDQRGVSNARAVGLDNVRGVYVYFADSDDWVEPELLGKLYNKAETENADISSCGFIIEGWNHSVPWLKPYASKDEYLSDAIANKWGVLWKNLIRTRLLSENKISFHPQFPAGEDYLFMVKCICLAKGVAFTNECLYHYNCTNKDSISSKRKISTCESHRNVTCLAMRFLEDIGLLRRYSDEILLRKLYVKNLFFYFGVRRWYGNFKEANSFKVLWSRGADLTLARRVVYSVLSVIGRILTSITAG